MHENFSVSGPGWKPALIYGISPTCSDSGMCLSFEVIAGCNAEKVPRSKWGAVTSSEPAVIMEEQEARARWENEAQEPELATPADGGGTGCIDGATDAAPHNHTMCRYFHLPAGHFLYNQKGRMGQTIPEKKVPALDARFVAGKASVYT